MKKIVFFIEQLCGGGAERVTSELANSICNSNYEVHVVTFNDKKEKEYLLDNKIVRHNLELDVKDRFVREYQRMKQIRNVVEEIRPYCIISLAMPITNAGIVLALHGTKNTIILSERNDPNNYPISKIHRILRNIAYIKCDGVVFQTEEARAYFSNNIKKKSTVILNPINKQLPEVFKGRRTSRIVNFCRLAKQKNLDLLIDAFEEIIKEFPEYSLHIYGEGPEKNHLMEKIIDKELINKAILHKYSENIYEEIEDAALFVSTSNYEGISNSMLEALALGIPTICTDCPIGGARQIIQNGLNGILIPVNHQKKLVQAMREVLTNVELANKISVEGTKIRQRLSISQIAMQWIDYIEMITEGRNKHEFENKKID